MPAYHPVFLKDEQVRIHNRGELERFLRPGFKYHHPISNEQLSLAGVKTKVTAVSYYHGGSCLYSLDGVPGVWREETVGDPDLTSTGAETASGFYAVNSEFRDGVHVIVIRDKSGRELLVYRCAAAEREAEAIRSVATVRSLSGFEHRYGLGPS